MSHDMSLDSISKMIEQKMGVLLEEKGIRSISDANTKQKGKAFLEFYVRDIGRLLYKFDDDLIDDGLRCDYKNDLNVDFIYRNEENYYIFQSKYKGSRNSLNRDEISGFARIHSRITDVEFFNKNANDQVRDLLRDFNKKSTAHYVLLTNDKVSEQLREEFGMATKEQSERFNDYAIDFELKALSEIKSDYKNAQSYDEPIPEEVRIPIEKIIDHFSENKHYAYLDLTNILDDSTKYMTILTTIKGTELKNLYNHYLGRLFNYNIRGYLGLNSINRQMRNTIEENPHMFYLFNNGISALCTDVRIEQTAGGRGLQLVVKHFQIINGAQTTCTIGTFKNESKLKDVRVLLRVTKTEDIKKEKGLNKKIVTYNNSQSVIKASDFRSNDDIQLFLQNKLPGYLYRASTPYRKLIYQPKRIFFKKTKDEIYLNMETLAKLLYAFDYEPTRIYANSNFLFDIDPSSGGKYWELFGDNNEECSFYNDERLKKVAAISMLWLFINDHLRNEAKSILNQKGETLEYQSYLAKWHFFWAYGHIIRTLYPDDSARIVNRILDGKAFTKDRFVNKWYRNIGDKIQEQLENEYLDSKPLKEDEEELSTKGFNFKNWLRNQKSFEKLKLKFKRARQDNFALDI
ncbi:MAG: AIPR family protein [Thermodesulfovibrionales bacterium]